jgi:ABC-type branched-subunit amino acid transport system substrate-binding protein
MFEGWETVATADSTKPLVEKIWKETEAYTGKKIDHDEKAIRQYDAINLLIAALKASGNPDDPTAIRDAYYKLDNYERGLGQAGGKGGFAVGINHTVTPDDVVIYSLKAGKMVALS